MKANMVSIDELHKATKQVRVRPYSRKGKPVRGYSATRRAEIEKVEKYLEKPISLEEVKKLHERIYDLEQENENLTRNYVALRTGETQAGYKRKHAFSPGDKVRVHPSAAYGGNQAWRETIKKIEDQEGIIERIFPDSDHVNVDFPDGTKIGVDAFKLIPEPGSATAKIMEAKASADKLRREEIEKKRFKERARREKIMTPSKLKSMIAETNPYFFTHDTMKFFGDRMSNYGVRSATIKTHDEPEGVEVWELYRKHPVKHGLRSSAYFRKDNYERAFTMKDIGEESAEFGEFQEKFGKTLVTIDDLYKAQKQVRVKPYSRKGKPVIGYSATRKMAEPHFHLHITYHEPGGTWDVSHSSLPTIEHGGQQVIKHGFTTVAKAKEFIEKQGWTEPVHVEDVGKRICEECGERLEDHKHGECPRKFPEENWREDVEKAQKQVQVKPYTRKGRPVIGYSAQRRGATKLKGVKEGEAGYVSHTQSEREYQQNELKRFYSQNDAHYDSVKEFSDWLEDPDHVLEQIEWIENGSYGAGACLALQKEFKGLTNRMNKKARIGQTALMAFYGKPFRHWQKLSPKAKASMDGAVTKWMGQERNWASDLIEKSASLVTIDDLYKAQKQVQVKPYSRGGKPVKGYSATRRMVEYHPFSKTPFSFQGKSYTRDELKRMGLDEEAHRAILGHLDSLPGVPVREIVAEYAGKLPNKLPKQLKKLWDVQYAPREKLLLSSIDSELKEKWNSKSWIQKMTIIDNLQAKGTFGVSEIGAEYGRKLNLGEAEEATTPQTAPPKLSSTETPRVGLSANAMLNRERGIKLLRAGMSSKQLVETFPEIFILAPTGKARLSPEGKAQDRLIEKESFENVLKLFRKNKRAPKVEEPATPTHIGGVKVKDIVSRVFPNYRGRKIRVKTDYIPKDLDSWWDEGNKSDYVFYELRSGRTHNIGTNHPMFEANKPRHLDSLPEGVAIVERSHFGAHPDTIRIYVHPSDMQTPGNGTIEQTLQNFHKGGMSAELFSIDDLCKAGSSEGVRRAWEKRRLRSKWETENKENLKDPEFRGRPHPPELWPKRDQTPKNIEDYKARVARYNKLPKLGGKFRSGAPEPGSEEARMAEDDAVVRGKSLNDEWWGKSRTKGAKDKKPRKRKSAEEQSATRLRKLAQLGQKGSPKRVRVSFYDLFNPSNAESIKLSLNDEWWGKARTKGAKDKGPRKKSLERFIDKKLQVEREKDPLHPMHRRFRPSALSSPSVIGVRKSVILSDPASVRQGIKALTPKAPKSPEEKIKREARIGAQKIPSAGQQF